MASRGEDRAVSCRAAVVLPAPASVAVKVKLRTSPPVTPGSDCSRQRQTSVSLGSALGLLAVEQGSQ